MMIKTRKPRPWKMTWILFLNVFCFCSWSIQLRKKYKSFSLNSNVLAAKLPPSVNHSHLHVKSELCAHSSIKYLAIWLRSYWILNRLHYTNVWKGVTPFVCPVTQLTTANDTAWCEQLKSFLNLKRYSTSFLRNYNSNDFRAFIFWCWVPSSAQDDIKLPIIMSVLFCSADLVYKASGKIIHYQNIF